MVLTMSDQRPPATLIGAKDFDADFLARMRALGREAESGNMVRLTGLDAMALRQALWSRLPNDGSDDE